MADGQGILKKYTIGIDIGGTFTDICCVDRTSNGIFVSKADSTPGDFSEGVMAALEVLAGNMAKDLQELLNETESIRHGTTVGTNALINRDGAKVGFLTTKGFEDTTLIMRAIGKVAGLSEEKLRHPNPITKPEPLVPRSMIRGIAERIDSEGRVLVPVSGEEIQKAVVDLVDLQGVESLAVSFLWSFINPDHEKKVEKIVSCLYPELNVSLSYRIAPIIREYARANTVIINAYLDRTMGTYVNRLNQRLQRAGFEGNLLIMQANGGAVSPGAMQAVWTVSSGPAAGMIAARYVSRCLKDENIITGDMGGTSYDVGLISRGSWMYERDPLIDRFHVSIPRVDVESIGAGGGTIAWVEQVTGRLMLGPHSAGSKPGPACYGQGGQDPTVTDADLLLGFLNPDNFLGGRKRLNVNLAAQSIQERVAGPLGLGVREAAADIYDIINARMADLIRKKVITTGTLPEQFVLYCYGGAGGVHAAGLCLSLGINKIRIFPYSSVFSAFGAGVSDIVHSKGLSFRRVLPCPAEEINKVLVEVENQLYHELETEGYRRGNPEKTAKGIVLERIFHMRYRKQLHELAVRVPVRQYGHPDLERIVTLFEEQFRNAYGKEASHPELGVELISITVHAIGRTYKPDLRRFASLAPARQHPASSRRQVIFTFPERDVYETAVYRYEETPVGFLIAGPAVIESSTLTVVVPPGWQAVMDQTGSWELNLI